MKVHPVADLFPMLPDDELADLAADIEANGLQQPIVVKDKLLIDGRNRLAACEMAGVEPTFVEMNGQDPVAFILSANLARRHMTKGQRAMAAAKVYTEYTDTAETESKVSKQYVSRARQVLEADPELADAVLAGAIPLNEAYKTIQDRRKEVARLAQQRERLRSIRPDLDEAVSEEVLSAAEALRQAEEEHTKRESERRAAFNNLRSVLTYLVSDSVTPGDLADDYRRLDVLGQFQLSDLEFAAKTMVQIAALAKEN